MDHALNIVASCSQTKSLDVPRALKLRSVPQGEAEERVRLWTRQREKASAQESPARELYSGTYWATVRRLLRRASELGYHARLWIASAGYGLVSAQRKLKPYSATFAPGNRDSVHRGELTSVERAHALRSWWKGLTIQKASTIEPPSLAALGHTNRRSSIIVIGGPAYMQAMQYDLLECAANLANPARLALVTSEDALEDLTSNVILSSARLVHKVGGSLPSLHARVAIHILEEARGRPLDAPNLREYARAILDAQPGWEVPQRERLSDRRVLDFISQTIRRAHRPTWSACLRGLRAAGQACEQHRFKHLFQSVMENRRAS